MLIEKKIWPKYFEEVASGKKKFELRLGDLEINEGDELLLCEYDPKTKEYTGREIKKKVSYVLKTKDVDFWSKENIDRYGYQIIQIDKKDINVFKLTKETRLGFTSALTAVLVLFFSVIFWFFRIQSAPYSPRFPYYGHGYLASLWQLYGDLLLGITVSFVCLLFFSLIYFYQKKYKLGASYLIHTLLWFILLSVILILIIFLILTIMFLINFT